jgi:hypothetical protein
MFVNAVIAKNTAFGGQAIWYISTALLLHYPIPTGPKTFVVISKWLAALLTDHLVEPLCSFVSEFISFVRIWGNWERISIRI